MDKNEYHKKYREHNYRAVITTERLCDLKRKYGETIAQELKKDFYNLLEGKPTKISLRGLKNLGLYDIYKKFLSPPRAKKEHKEIIKVDIEPKWINLIPILLDIKDKNIVIKELNKLAVIGDMVRQAEKEKRKLVFDFREPNKEPSNETEEEKAERFDNGLISSNEIESNKNLKELEREGIF